MKDSLILEGKIYISAKRAAKIINYAQDYIGQLCRSGKLDCKMIGRSWYVTEESLLSHREQAVDATQERVLKVTKSISPEFDAPVVEKKIQVVSESIPTPVAASVIAPTVALVTAPVQPVAIVTPIFPVAAPIVSPVSSFKYEAENKPALPEITKKLPASFSISKKAADLTATPFATKLVVKNSQSATPSRNLPHVASQISPVQIKLPSEIIKAQTVRAALEKVEKDERAKVAAEARAARIAAEASAIASAAARAAATPAPVAAPVATPVVAPAPRIAPARPVVSPIQNVVAKIQAEPKVAVLTLSAPKTIALGIAAVLIVASGYLFTVTGKNLQKVATGDSRAASITSNFFGGIFRTLGFGKPATLATIPKSPEVNTNDSSGSFQFNGIGVAPSTGSVSGDAVAKKRIQTSFSDEVSIQPDDSGTAGVITPVFKKGSGDDFMYVLVPVKEKKQ